MFFSLQDKILMGLLGTNASLSAHDIVVHFLSRLLPSSSNYTHTPLERRFKCKEHRKNTIYVVPKPCNKEDYKTNPCCKYEGIV